MDEQNTNRLDPIDTFKTYQARLETEKALQEYPWTWAEVSRLKAENPHALAALKPYIDQSHARGDYKNPWELDRQAAREYLKEHGIEGEPWSLAEVRAITGNPELWAEYQGEVKKAQAEGRIIKGPGLDMNEVYHFGGEADQGPGSETFERNLNAKLATIDQAREGHKMIDEAWGKVKVLIKEGLGSVSVNNYLFGTLKRIEQKTSAEYPVEAHPDYAKLKEAFRVASTTDAEEFTTVFNIETGEPKN